MFDTTSQSKGNAIFPSGQGVGAIRAEAWQRHVAQPVANVNAEMAEKARSLIK